MATLIILLMGLTRIAMGVAWATDVLAGRAFGAAWALVRLLIARRFTGAPHRRVALVAGAIAIGTSLT